MLISCARCGKVHERGKCDKPKEWTKKNKDISLSTGWIPIRNNALDRDKHLCRLCMSKGRVNFKRLQVHHIIPRSVDINRIHDINNVITVCEECHKTIHHDRNSWRKYVEILNKLVEMKIKFGSVD